MHLGVVSHLLEAEDQEIQNITQTILNLLPDIVTDDEKSQE